MSRVLLGVVLVLLLVGSAAVGLSDDEDGPVTTGGPEATRGTVRHGAPPTSVPTQAPGAPDRPRGGPTTDDDDSVPAGDPYVDLAEELQAQGVSVWFDTDLVGSWLAGPAAFRTTVARLRALAQVPGVVGFKIADEFGYEDGLASEDQARRFLQDARAALDTTKPRVEVLVDVVVPELGCLSWTGGAAQQVCGSEARADHPAASLSAVSGYLEAGLIDVLDLSTGLREPDVYERWGTTRDGVQAAAWSHVEDLGWGRLVRLQGRKALAEPGGYRGSPERTAADVRTYVSIPLERGARAVQLWTWRQPYDDGVVSLLPDDLSITPLWATLRQLRADGAELLTNMTPSAMPQDPAARARECALAAEVFSTVLVAAGTG